VHAYRKQDGKTIRYKHLAVREGFLKANVEKPNEYRGFSATLIKSTIQRLPIFASAGVRWRLFADFATAMSLEMSYMDSSC
jgi:hypothetical protein